MVSKTTAFAKNFSHALVDDALRFHAARMAVPNLERMDTPSRDKQASKSARK